MPSHHAARLLGLLMIFVIVLSLSAIHSTIPAHAASTPTLSIDPSTQPLATAGSTVTYRVNVSNISPDHPLAGFNIYVRTNNFILTPTAITLGNFLSAGFENANCVNGVGTGCAPNDGPGVAHEAFDSFDSKPGNGTLFTISYQAVAGPYSFLTFVEPGSSTQLFELGVGCCITFKPVDGTYGNVPALPVASFTWTPQIPFEHQKVTFNASSSTTPPGTKLVGYSWAFIAEALPPTHAKGVVTYNIFDSANWTVILVVTNDLGVSSHPASSDFYVAAKPARDLAVCTSTKLTATCIPTISTSQVNYIHPGAVITIKVDVVNLGNTNEIRFNLSLTVAGHVFKPPPYPDVLTPKVPARFSFQWNTTGLPPDSYTIHAHIDPLLNEKGQINETNIANNDAYYIVRLIYPLKGTLLPFDMAQFGGLVVLSLFTVSFILFLVRRGRNRKMLAQQELL